MSSQHHFWALGLSLFPLGCMVVVEKVGLALGWLRGPLECPGPLVGSGLEAADSSRGPAFINCVPKDKFLIPLDTTFSPVNVNNDQYCPTSQN